MLPPPPPPLPLPSLMLSPQPRSTAPNAGPSYMHLCPPPHSLPIFLLSIPLLSRQAARMAGMETFTDGSTGKFSTSTKTHTEMKGWRGSSILPTLLHVSFHLSSPQLYYTLPPFPFSNHKYFFSVSIPKSESLWSTCRGTRHSSW